MSKQITRNYVKSIASAYDAPAVAVGYCGAQNLLNGCARLGYGAGLYGWNYDAYLIDDARGNYAVVCTGYRSIPGRDANKAAAIVERFARSMRELASDNMSAAAHDLERGLAALRSLFVQSVN